MNTSKAKRRIVFPLSKLIVPLFALVVFLFFWRMGRWWIVVPVVGFLAFYYMVFPRLVRFFEDRFDRNALVMLTTGRAAEIPGLCRKNIFLQLFGKRNRLDAKLGLAYAQTGDFTLAIPCFQHALTVVPEEELPVIQSGLAKALMVHGDFPRAEIQGMRVLDWGIRLPELMVVVARCRVGLGRIDQGTEKLLAEAEHLSPNEDVALMIALTRIEAALATGRKPGLIPEGADSPQRFLRAWIHMVRGLLRERAGKGEEAAKSFSMALGLCDERFIAQIVSNRTALRSNTESEEPLDSVSGGGSVDPAIRRKKRKRR